MSGRNTLRSRSGWAIGFDVGNVERLDVVGVVEDVGELAGEGVELVVGQFQPRQKRHMRHFLSRVSRFAMGPPS